MEVRELNMIYHAARIALLAAVLVLCTASASTNKESGPNASDTGVTGTCPSEQDCGTTEGHSAADKSDDNNNNGHNGWKPFRITSEEKWIPFDSVVGKYIDWHKQALADPEIECSERKVLVFTPSAGLGDSIGALTAAFMYALRTGRLFFIDWKPFPWSVTFKDLPFFYNYDKAAALKNEATGKPVICPEHSDRTSFISGHVTSAHPIIAEGKEFDFHTQYDRMVHFFMKPSAKVQAVLDDVTRQHFENDEDDVILHKVAIVMRTGIGEYNQFLSVGDEANFVKCFITYARALKQKSMARKNNPKQTKFAVLVTSDNDDAKRNAVKALRDEADKNELDIDVVTLEDSAVHVMHMTPEESRLKRVREKLRKTIAEFFLIASCDARFLTHGSLFGRSASELSSPPEENNFFISDSHCDGHREKHSYLECHNPKYPSVCGFE